MPRVKCIRDYKKDCTKYADDYPLLAVGVFEAGNTYDMPEELIAYFRKKGVVEGGESNAPEAAPTEIEVPE